MPNKWGRKRWAGLALATAATGAMAAGIVLMRSPSTLNMSSLAAAIAGGSAQGAASSAGAGAASGASGGGNAAPGALGSGEGTLTNRYIVVYRDEPLATYTGDIAGLPAPERVRNRVGQSRIAVNGARARNYVRFLEGEQVAYEAKITSTIGRRPQVERRLQHALNAAVMEMTPNEAGRVERLPEVAFVESYREYAQDTDTGPALIGAPALWNAAPTQYRGEGVVFGIIDSGINFGSPSFAATDETGYTHVNPLGAGTYLGTCRPGEVDEGRCNDKLIGGYNFVCAAPGNMCGEADVREEPGFGDTNSHGSHVASTAAGNVRTAQYSGAPVRISGVAPRGNIVAYDVCYTQISTNRGLCPNTSSLFAVNQAIADGIVDVINFSIGGGESPWSDAVSLAFLNATDAGIYVATSAGNSGPGPNTMGHLEPWTASTAAAQHGRGSFSMIAAISGPGTVPEPLRALVLTEGNGGVALTGAIAPTTPVRVSQNFSTISDGCAPYPAGTFQGAIAVMRRGSCSFADKTNNAAAAGAVAVLMSNNTEGLISPTVTGTTIPVFGVLASDGEALRAFAAANGNTSTGGIGFPAVGIPNLPDVLAAFSSRGPAGTFDLVKPDVTAPGVDVLAVVSGTTITGSETALGVISGTSMASPHHAGAAGLLRQAQPTWTVQEIKSALMMTATQAVSKEDSITPADAFAMGAGRVQVDQAVRAGLVMHETKARFQAANPAVGGDISSLNLPSMAKRACLDSCIFTRTFRNVLPTRQSWTVKLNGLSGVVSPSLLTLAPGESKSVRFVVTTGALPKDGSWNFGGVTIAPQGGNTTQPVLRLPVAVAVQPPQINATPANRALTLASGASGSAALRIDNLGGSALEWQIDNTGVGTRTLVAQLPNNANGRRSTRFTDAATVGARAQLAADDFTLTDTTAITNIRADGFVNGGTLATATNINWSIYRDVGGNPEGNPEVSPQLALWSYTSTSTGSGVGISGFASIGLDLAAAGQSVSLPAGRYWLVVSVRAPLATGWFWFNATSGDNVYRNAVVNPDGSGTWAASVGAPGMAYAMQGRNTCGASWIGTPARAFGRTAPGTGIDNQVQINAAGLPPGTYNGYICVASNDPVRPKIALRVSLTVTP